MKVRHFTRYDDTQNKIDLHKHKSASYEDEKNGFFTTFTEQPIKLKDSKCTYFYFVTECQCRLFLTIKKKRCITPLFYPKQF